MRCDAVMFKVTNNSASYMDFKCELSSLFLRKIIASVIKSLHQDRGLWYLHLQWTLVLTNSEGTKTFCVIQGRFGKSKIFERGRKMKKSFFSITLKSIFTISWQAYNDVKNISIFVCCFLDCKVFS